MSVTLCAACAENLPETEVFTVPPILACAQCGSMGRDRQVFRGKPPTAAPIIVVELDALQREAALKMPIKDAMRECARHLSAQLDTALKKAVEHYLGRDLRSEADVRGRLTLYTDPPDYVTQPEARGETYAMDGKPILWAGPVTIERTGGPSGEQMHASRTLRLL